VLGFPLVTFVFVKANLIGPAAITPPGAVYLAQTMGVGLLWALAPTLIAIATLWSARRSLAMCELHLRKWYDRNHGLKMVD
jgi:hypothetical protein